MAGKNKGRHSHPKHVESKGNDSAEGSRNFSGKGGLFKLLGFLKTPLGISLAIFLFSFIILFAIFIPKFIESKGAQMGDTVKVDYLGKFEDGTVFDTSIEAEAKSAGLYDSAREYSPMEFSLGSNAVIPGFERAIIGMDVGEKKTVRIPPEDAYGYPQESMMQNVTVPKYLLEPYSNLKSKGINETVGSKSSTIYGDAYLVDINSTSALFELRPTAGARLIFPNGVSAKIVSVSEDKNNELVLLMDANHPLAGQALVFEITLKELQKKNAA